MLHIHTGDMIDLDLLLMYVPHDCAYCKAIVNTYSVRPVDCMEITTRLLYYYYEMYSGSGFEL